MRPKVLLFALALILVSTTPALASVRITVHIPSQQMEVSVDGVVLYTWRVSTAAPGRITPTGTFRPYWLSEKHRSSLYNWAPMPHAVFYDRNFAIHGTVEENRIGTPASKGCVRLARENAKLLFELVREHGFQRVAIVITR